MTENSPIIGDLLEEYREVVLPARGRIRARLWFARQLASLMPPWACGGILIGAVFVGRSMLDWNLPPANFHTRATLTSMLLFGLLLGAGVSGAWRSGSIVRGAISSVCAAVLGAVLTAIGITCVLAIQHDAATIAAIHASGGLAEAYELPLMMILPGVVLGALGGLGSAAFRRLRSA